MAGQHVALRGMERILARETNLSDLLQQLTDLDPSPWRAMIGFVPEIAERERGFSTLKGKTGRAKGVADLVLTDGRSEFVVEVKLGHVLSADQRARYETGVDGPLLLMGLEADRDAVAGNDRWRFLPVAEVFGRWSESSSAEASSLADSIAAVLLGWDQQIGGVFGARGQGLALNSVRQKFVARVISRRMAKELEALNWRTYAGVPNGGGIPIVQAWAAIDGDWDRSVIAEVRWNSNMTSGQLRFGTDFSFLENTRENRAEAWACTLAMDESIAVDSLRADLANRRPDLDALVMTSGPGRKEANPDVWEQVVERGLGREVGAYAKRRTPKMSGFVGDGSRRFEAVGELDFSRATATDLVELIDVTLRYLSERVPGER